MLIFKNTLKLSAEHELDVSEIKHMLKGLAKLGCKEMRYQANPLTALAQKSRKVYSIIKVKLLKKLPHLRGTMEITAQTSPITYVKSEQ